MPRRSKHLASREFNFSKLLVIICAIAAALAAAICAIILISRAVDKQKLDNQGALLSVMQTLSPTYESADSGEPTTETDSNAEVTVDCEILDEYKALYEQNNDLIGWLRIDDTVIDYPVMQTPGDNLYYVYLDFSKQDNSNGSLIMDKDAVVGVGTSEDNYEGGTAPSTNLLIHGHNMKSGEMFGSLSSYADQDYEEAHSIINFDSLYEHRQYEVMAVFYSEIYYPEEEVFKFYEFFQADTEEEFDYWYDNVMDLNLYDTGVTAEFGDEFLTLTTCSYQVEDGRFVVVAKRIA